MPDPHSQRYFHLETFLNSKQQKRTLEGHVILIKLTH